MSFAHTEPRPGITMTRRAPSLSWWGKRVMERAMALSTVLDTVLSCLQHGYKILSGWDNWHTGSLTQGRYFVTETQSLEDLGSLSFKGREGREGWSEAIQERDQSLSESLRLETIVWIQAEWAVDFRRPGAWRGWECRAGYVIAENKAGKACWQLYNKNPPKASEQMSYMIRFNFNFALFSLLGRWLTAG